MCSRRPCSPVVSLTCHVSSQGSQMPGHVPRFQQVPTGSNRFQKFRVTPWLTYARLGLRVGSRWFQGRGNAVIPSCGKMFVNARSRTCNMCGCINLFDTDPLHSPRHFMVTGWKAAEKQQEEQSSLEVSGSQVSRFTGLSSSQG